MKILNLILVISTILISLFIFWGFSSLLDFFPWGDSKAYVIWEPLLLYFIVPIFVTVGFLFVLLNKRIRKTGFYIFIIGLLLLLPSFFGFDMGTDLIGRWSGVVIPLLSMIFLNRYFVKIIQEDF